MLSRFGHPIGSINVISLPKVHFVAILELSEKNQYYGDGWTVELWYSSRSGNNEWKAIPFEHKDNSEPVVY